MPEPQTVNKPVETAAAESRGALHTLLYLDGVTVSFDGFKALNDLSNLKKP